MFSNRSAAHASAGDFPSALTDAERCVSLHPTWAKGYSRLGAAFHGLGAFTQAADAYRRGLAVDSTMQILQTGLVDAEVAAMRATPREAAAAQDEKAKPDASPETAEMLSQLRQIAAMLARPEIYTLMMLNEKTRPFLLDQVFAEKLRAVHKQPDSLAEHIKDPRMVTVLSDLLGVKIMTPEDAMREEAEKMKREERAAQARKEAEAKEKARVDAEKAAAEAASMTPEQKAAKAAKAAADALKAEGNALYKQKDLDGAAEKYTAAIATYPNEASYYTNRAAVHFERSDYASCEADCDQAIEVVKAQRGDLALLARAMTRKGTCLRQQGNLEAAIEMYQKALLEHRNADTLKRLQETEKQRKKRDDDAYVDMGKCAEEKEFGNLAFKESRYPDAVRHYTEALKRGPEQVRYTDKYIYMPYTELSSSPSRVTPHLVSSIEPSHQHMDNPTLHLFSSPPHHFR